MTPGPSPTRRPGGPRGRLPVVLVALLAVGGCASYEPGPLTVAHPAHPRASAAPPRAPSRTLTYTAEDVPTARPVPPVAVPQPEYHGHGGAPPAPGTAGGAGAPDVAGRRTVVGEGEVVATVPGSAQIVVDHGEIKGFMEAMTMGYRVDPPSLLADLKEGDKVRFTIDVERRAIVRIERLP